MLIGKGRLRDSVLGSMCFLCALCVLCGLYAYEALCGSSPIIEKKATSQPGTKDPQPAISWLLVLDCIPGDHPGICGRY